MDTGICYSSLSNARNTYSMISDVDISPPPLIRQNAFIQQKCIICTLKVPIFLASNINFCSPQCFTIMYHDSKILNNPVFYKKHYDGCQKILYNILLVDLANIILSYHDYNLSNYISSSIVYKPSNNASSPMWIANDFNYYF